MQVPRQSGRYDEETAVVEEREVALAWLASLVMMYCDLSWACQDLTEATAEELQTIKISRQKLEVWAHEPFLEQTVVGTCCSGSLPACKQAWLAGLLLASKPNWQCCRVSSADQHWHVRGVADVPPWHGDGHDHSQDLQLRCGVLDPVALC